eukprot:Hpha_TRINITY_DN16194_c8_g1::TRINITY_DN16194_c8_g1_i1::g.7241::m.7241
MGMLGLLLLLRGTASLVSPAAMRSSSPSAACFDLSNWTFAVNDGKGSGKLTRDAVGDGCDGVLMSSATDGEGMAASFRSPRLTVRAGHRYNASFKIRTEGLVPTEGDGAAYLTGGVYLHFYDVNGDSGAWNPQFGSLAPTSTNGAWSDQKASFVVPTTAAFMDVHLAFAAHTFTYSPNRMLGGRAKGTAALASLMLSDVGQVSYLPSTIQTPDDPILQGAVDQAFKCLHNSQQSGNFTVGAGYTISGNISPDLTFGVHGIRRTGHQSYLEQIRKQWEWHAPDAKSGKYTVGRVLGQIFWPLGVDEIFSFTGEEEYMRSHLPLVDASLKFVDEHSDERGLVTLVPNNTGHVGGGADWVDWYRTRLDGPTFIFHIKYIHALRRFSKIHDEFKGSFGDAGLAASYAKRASELEATLRQVYWLGDHWWTNVNYRDEGEWLDDTVWSIFHGVANASMQDTLFGAIDANVSFFEGIPTRWAAFPNNHWDCSWFGRLGAGDILARARVGQHNRSFDLLRRMSSVIVSQHDIYEGYDMSGCGLERCGCTTAGYGDYLEHCGGIIWSVVEGVFGLSFESTPLWAAEITPRFPQQWRNASLTTYVRGSALRVSLLDRSVYLENLGGQSSPLHIRVVGCSPEGVATIAQGEKIELNCAAL